MPRHRARSVLALLPLALVAAGCSNSVPDPLRSQSQSLAGDQTLRVALPEAPRSLDPALVQDEREAAVVSQFSEPLLRPQPGLRDVQPAAAESYSVAADGLTWTFRLRSGGRWSDGQPVRAQDFVFQWKRLIDPRTAAPHADMFAAVVKGGVEAAALDARDTARVETALGALRLRAPDDLTFVVETPEPAPQLKWLATLPEGGPFRPDLVARPGTAGSGPYHVSDATRDRTTMLPNPGYWAGRTTLAHLTLVYGVDSSAAVAGYRAQEYDLAANLGGVLTRRDRGEALRVPELTVFWVDFNVERAPFSDPRVRLAFAEAIDRDALAAEAFGGRAFPATTLVPAGMPGHHPEFGKPQERNADAARQLLEAAGVPRDQLSAIPFIVRDRAFDRSVAGLVASDLRNTLGVGVDVQPIPLVEYDKRLRTGDFGLAGPAGWTADYPDQGNFFDTFMSTSGANGSRYRSARYDALVRLAATELAGERRDQLYAQASQLLEQDSPVIFLAQRQRLALVRPYVKGLRPLPVDAWPGASGSASVWIASH